MPGFQKPRRRAKPGPSKNELKVSQERDRERMLEQSGRLGERYPHVQGLEISYQMKTPEGAVLAQEKKRLKPDDSLMLDVPCEGGCGNGLFLLTDAIHDLLSKGAEQHQGRGSCRAASYKNAAMPCGTELIYQIRVI
jgi:hypothetical protein